MPKETDLTILDLSQFTKLTFSKDFPPTEAMLEKMVAFDQKCFIGEGATTSKQYGPPALKTENILSDIEHANQFIVLTNSSGEIICVMQYFIKGKPGTEKELHIMSVAIDPEYRRTGMSHLVLEKLYQITRENSLDLITLRVDPLNIPAIKRYLKEGFVIVGARTRDLGEGHHSVVTLAATKRFSVDLSHNRIDTIMGSTYF